MKFHLETYGCQANELESDYVAGMLERDGWTRADKPDDSDWMLINTCAVRRHAEQKVFSRLGVLAEWKGKDPGRRIGVLGCMAVSYKADLLKRFPQVDLLAGPDQYALVPGWMDAPGASGDRVLAGFDPKAFPSNPLGDGSKRFKAFVEVMKGCNNHCSYCVVPSVRGPEVSRPHRDVMEEAARLVSAGVREITLLGQNVNSYSSDGIGFPALLKAVGLLEGLKRVRFFTSHPKDLSDELIETMAGVPSVCEYLHLPVQSGSDAVLRRMNRRYTVAYFRQLVEKLRAYVKDIAVTSDLIVGFPGETREDFEATLALLEALKFDSVFSFKYSPRPGTEAARQPDDVPPQVKEERLKRLNQVAWEHARQRHRARVGRVEEVLAEAPADRTPDSWFGKTRQNKTAVFKVPDGRTLSPGELVRVKMEDSRIAVLYGNMA